MKLTKCDWCAKCGFEFVKKDLPIKYKGCLSNNDKSLSDFLEFTCPRCEFSWGEKLEDLEETDEWRKHIHIEDGDFYFRDKFDVRYGPFKTEEDALNGFKNHVDEIKEK